MLKSILLFIKAHAVVTAITTVAVVTMAVVTPIAVTNYKLDNNVKSNIYMLAKAENQVTSENIELEIENNEPLKFRIEKEIIENSGYAWEEDENGQRRQIDGRNKCRI